MKLPRTIFAVLLFVFAAFTPAIAQQSLRATVTSVKDGNTLIAVGDRDVKFVLQVRLVEIPDDSHPLYSDLTDHLSKIVLNKQIVFRPQINNGEWIIARIDVEGVDLTSRLLRDGVGWYTTEGQSLTTDEDEGGFRANEAAARDEKRGVWAFPEILRPSMLRKDVEAAAEPFSNPAVAKAAWNTLGPSVEHIFGYETKSIDQNSCDGKVVGVVDGDTVKILGSGNRLMSIRLAGIDAPEKGQDFGAEAKKFLSDLVFGKTVKCVSDKRDRYGRIIAKLLVDGADVNLAMIKGCMAWHYKEYASEQSPADRATSAAAEVAARNAKCGLWQDPNAIKPSDFRRQRFTSNYVEKRNPRGMNVPPGTNLFVIRPYELLRGPRGGCLYYTQTGRKQYVDRSECN